MKVAIFSPRALPLFDESVRTRFGGAELRAATFARGLARSDDHQVAMVLFAESAPHVITIDGVCLVLREQHHRVRDLIDRRRALRVNPRSGNVEIVRWGADMAWMVPLQAGYFGWNQLRRRLIPRHPRSSTDYLVSNADAVLTFCVNDVSADIIATARCHRQRSILFVAADSDLDPRYRRRSYALGLHGESAHACAIALQTATAIVLQTEVQRQMLREHFQRDGVVIANPIDMQNTENPYPGSPGPFALWIGRADNFHKRPDICLRLARRCPDIPFVLVMNATNQELFGNLQRNAPANVTIIERVTQRESEQLMAAAHLFVNTSRFEGFPNTFLLAGKYRVPVVSFEVDPDFILTRHHGGACAQASDDRFVTATRQLWDQPDVHARCGESLFAYVRDHHGLEDRVSELERLLERVRCAPANARL